MGERKHIVAIEVDRLITATKGNRNAARDRCLMLLMFRHRLARADLSATPWRSNEENAFDPSRRIGPIGTPG